MAKRDRTIEKLDELAALKRVTDPAIVQPALAAALKDRTHLVVAKAAKMAMDADLRALAEVMLPAFDRFIADEGKLDPRCHAKNAIAEALLKFNGDYRNTYLRGLHHVQREPVWGGSRDTAARLRGLSALGLVALGYRDVMYELADLLFDEDAEARQLACRALGGTGVDAAALLLRAKVNAGKDSPDVLGECFASLLSLQLSRSIDFIARFLNHADNSLAEAAALSIGTSRNDRAFELLDAALDNCFHSEQIPTLLIAIATTRHPKAIERLLSEMSESKHTGDAVAALRVFRNDSAVTARVEARLAQLNNVTLHRRWRNG